MPMRKKDRKWLQEVADRTDCFSGMYPGLSEDILPASVAIRLGHTIERYQPHNPIHKDRYVITPQGRDALASN